MNCPCDNQCREECDLCKTENDIKIGMERMLNLPDKLPNEECNRIQEILKKDCDIEKKAYFIYSYYMSKIPYHRNPWARKDEPPLYEEQIRLILEKRLST